MINKGEINMENPKITKKTTTTLKVSGLYDVNGLLLDYLDF